MNVTDFNDLYRHMEWADASVWTAVQASDTARSDAKVRETLYHLHMVQRAFLVLWRGEPRETPFPVFDDIDELMLWGRTYYGEAFAYLETLTDVAASEPLPVPWAEMIQQRLGQPPAPVTIAETALQVALHSLYHRGQVNARLSAIGAAPPLVDYIAWVWLGRPAPAWPAAAP